MFQIGIRLQTVVSHYTQDRKEIFTHMASRSLPLDRSLVFQRCSTRVECLIRSTDRGRGLYYNGRIATAQCTALLLQLLALVALAGMAINGGVALNGNRIYERGFIVPHYREKAREFWKGCIFHTCIDCDLSRAFEFE